MSAGRTLLSSLAGSSRAAARDARRPFRRSASTATGSAPRVSYRPLALAAAAVALPAYMYWTRIRLDSEDPDTHDLPSSHPIKAHALDAAQKQGKSSGRTVSIGDVLKHKDDDRYWVVINGEVYDMTEWIDDHPGGPDIIKSNRSKDVTPIFKPRHPSDQLEEENIPPNVHHLGRLDADSASEEEKAEIRLKVSKGEEEENERIERERKAMEERGLGVIVNMKDFEKFAEPLLSKVAWAYYNSAGDDSWTKQANADAYRKVLFRPRILRKVAEVDATTTILGKHSSIPVFISPAAMAKLGHPDGEINLTKGAHSTGIIQVISSNASCSIDEMVAARAPSQPLFFQLYVNRKRNVAEDLIAKINNVGMDAIFLTGDAPVGGKREQDLRLKGEFDGPSGGVSEKSGDTQGVSQAMFAGVDPDLNWDDIKWIRSKSSLPIIVKGVQSVEDALMAYEKGAEGILISNHGGRQLDTTRPSLDVLLEIRKFAPHLLRSQYRGPTGCTKACVEQPDQLYPPDAPASGKGERPFHIFVDGGVNRGTDVIKALCLGAEAVGVGRGFLYAQSIAGVEGVEHAVKILETEIQLTMRLLGVNRLDQLRPSMVEVKE